LEDSLHTTKVYSPADRQYLAILEEIGAHLKPRNYLEIGTFRGASLACFDCEAIAIDPDFQLEETYRPRSSVTHFYKMESDTFFNGEYLRGLSIFSIDVLFIDGLHIFEQALRDFANCERVSSALSVILVHDCFPQVAEMAQREWNRDGRVVKELRHMWCGDVWKLLYCLREYRPDLKSAYIDCQPSGLAMFWGLDRDNQVLASRHEALTRQFRDVSLTDQMLERLIADFPFQPQEQVIDELVRYRRRESEWKHVLVRWLRKITSTVRSAPMGRRFCELDLDQRT
jgi:predicted O-methyltransferase YrrM